MSGSENWEQVLHTPVHNSTRTTQKTPVLRLFGRWMRDKLLTYTVTITHVALQTSLRAATAWMHQKDMVLVKRASEQRANPVWLHYCEAHRITKLTDTENIKQLSRAKGGKVQRREFYLKRRKSLGMIGQSLHCEVNVFNVTRLEMTVVTVNYSILALLQLN